MNKFEHTVLVIDDDMLNISALTYLLDDEFNIHTEMSGEKGLEAAKALRPDVILLDIVMPDMNGFEVIKALKNDDETKNIPVLFVTGLNNTKDEEQGLVLGAADYINKPFSGYIVKLRIKNQLQITDQVQIINELSSTDSLTGMGTRQAFHDAMESEWRKAERTKTPIGFAILNIKDFKKYNEEHGQQKGDEALVRLSQIITCATTKACDKVARWGGDEFAILSPDSSAEYLQSVLDKICKKIEKDELLTINGETIDVSTGAYVVTPGNDETSIDSLILDTYNALSEDKNSQNDRAYVINKTEGDA